MSIRASSTSEANLPIPKPTSHPILECSDVIRLGQKCNTLLKRLTVEQLEEFNEIIDQSLCDPIDDNQIPKILEFTLKLIENIIKVDNDKGTGKIIHLPSYIRVPHEKVPTTTPRQKRPTVTEVLDIYYIPNETSKETFKRTELDSEEGKVDLDLLQKLVAACDDLVLELTPAPEIETADRICTLGPYCENRSEIKRDEKKELEVEIDKYEDERKEEEEDLHNNRIRVAEIGSADEMNTVVPCCENGVEVEKDETKAYEMDYVEGTFESSLETGIDIVIEISWNHQKPTGMDSERKLDKLEEVSLEEKFVDDELPDERALSHACKEWMRKVCEFRKTAKEINEPTERELTEGTVKVRDCSQGRIEVKMDETKEPSCCHKSVELGNMTGAFMSGISICKSEGTTFELDLKPIERGSLDNLKSIEESINKGIKTGKNNDVAIACRMDSNKEKKEGKCKKIEIVKCPEKPRTQATYSRGWKSGGGVCHNSKL
ncbi:hypothetical protein C2G38_2224152 [Gigaspora rosea]|uniref:Uncharacterized protein n=1 Tax=Gigaspora rosea TaxID=44941 RepID=A0A397U272_9GLOM|nr:hypothetical protein C2G38_2224152 [Gigaspora rosea]